MPCRIEHASIGTSLIGRSHEARMRPDRAVSRFHHGSGSSMKYLAPSAPLSIGGLLDQWLVLFRASWRRCWTLPLVMIPIIAALQFFVLAPGVYRSPPGLPPGQILIHLLASSRAPRPYGPWRALPGNLSLQALVSQRGRVVIRRRGGGRVSREFPPRPQGSPRSACSRRDSPRHIGPSLS